MRLSNLACLAASTFGCLLLGCSDEASDLASNSPHSYYPGVAGQGGNVGGPGDGGAPKKTDSGASGAEGGSIEEQCGNGLDDDGNGQADEDCACKAGDKQSCFVGVVAQAGVGACRMGSQSCVTGGSSGEIKAYVWGPCTGYGKPTAELCNDSDDNCNGLVDDKCTCANGEKRDCANPCGKGSQTCANGSWTECDAPLPAAEVCGDGVDQDCNGADLACPTCSDGIQNQDETAVDCGGVCGLSVLYSNVTPEACDDGSCAEQSQTSFALASRSVVGSIRTYAGQNGLSGNSFGYTVSQGGTTILSGTTSLLSCQPGMEWCFFGDESVNQILDPGSYVLSPSWPRMCATPGNGCQGFVHVMGCVATAP